MKPQQRSGSYKEEPTGSLVVQKYKIESSVGGPTRKMGTGEKSQ